MTLVGRHIALIGDSWVAGPPGVALQAALEAQGAMVLRDGIVGAGVVSTMARLRDILNETAGYDTVLLLLGVNDVIGTRSRDNYQALATALRAAGLKVFIMSDATISDPDLPYRHKVRVIEIYQRDAFGADHSLPLASSANDEWFNTSFFHLTPEGAQLWVARITPAVLSLLDDSPLASLGRGLLHTVPGGWSAFARLL